MIPMTDMGSTTTFASWAYQVEQGRSEESKKILMIWLAFFWPLESTIPGIPGIDGAL